MRQHVGVAGCQLRPLVPVHSPRLSPTDKEKVL
jgi:hypothetical protein